MTLGHVVKLKAEESAENSEQLARMAPFIGIAKSGDDKKDAVAVGDRQDGAVSELSASPEGGVRVKKVLPDEPMRGSGVRTVGWSSL